MSKTLLINDVNIKQINNVEKQNIFDYTHHPFLTKEIIVMIKYEGTIKKCKVFLLINNFEFND